MDCGPMDLVQLIGGTTEAAAWTMHRLRSTEYMGDDSSKLCKIVDRASRILSDPATLCAAQKNPLPAACPFQGLHMAMQHLYQGICKLDRQHAVVRFFMSSAMLTMLEGVLHMLHVHLGFLLDVCSTSSLDQGMDVRAEISHARKDIESVSLTVLAGMASKAAEVRHAYDGLMQEQKERERCCRQVTQDTVHNVVEGLQKQLPKILPRDIIVALNEQQDCERAIQQLLQAADACHRSQDFQEQLYLLQVAAALQQAGSSLHQQQPCTDHTTVSATHVDKNRLSTAGIMPADASVVLPLSSC